MSNENANFLDFGQTLGRSEMKKVMAGSEGCNGDHGTCEEFYSATGCYPTYGEPSATCEGNDGCTYNSASSEGSCG